MLRLTADLVEPSFLIIGAILVSLVLMQVNQRVASPLLSIADRWLRWFVFAFGVAHLCREFKWLDKPYWVLVVVFWVVRNLSWGPFHWLGSGAAGA